MSIILVTAVLGGAAIAAQLDEDPPARGETATATDPETAVTYKYLGTKRCRMCHSVQYDSWRRSPKSDSFAALKPQQRSGAKVAAGLSPNTDYRTDARCLPCHTVGFGRPGGYAIPDPSDDDQQRRVANREGAGCEACHGPGSGFVKVMSDVYDTERPYHPDEVRAAGRRPVTQAVCNSCHNERALCVLHAGETKGGPAHKKRFQVDVSDRTGYHEAVPFKYRIPESGIQPIPSPGTGRTPDAHGEPG